MKKFTVIIIAFLCNTSHASDNWFLSIVGGSGDEVSKDIYDGSVQVYRAGKSLGISDSKLITLLGDNGTFCYLKPDQNIAEDNRKALEAFQKNPKDCKLANSIFHAELGDFGQGPTNNFSPFVKRPNVTLVCQGDPVKPIDAKSTNIRNQLDRDISEIYQKLYSGRQLTNLFDLAGDGRSHVNGSATHSEIDKQINTVIESVKNNAEQESSHHIFLDISDHGMKSEQGWSIGLSNGEEITNIQLQNIVDRLNGAGITVHINAEACNSGGFNNIKTKSNEEKNSNIGVCTTSDTDEDTPAAGSNDPIHQVFAFNFHRNFAKYGSQLTGFACSLGQDSWNRPQTSLDKIVSDWMSRQSGQSQQMTTSNCNKTPNSLVYYMQLGKTLVDSLLNPKEKLRKSLILEFQNSFEQIYRQCSENREMEVQLANDLNACLPASDLPFSVRELLQTAYTAAKGIHYDTMLIESHKRFLAKADHWDLEKYRKVFCCLAYDFKTGKVPEICPN